MAFGQGRIATQNIFVHAVVVMISLHAALASKPVIRSESAGAQTAAARAHPHHLHTPAHRSAVALLQTERERKPAPAGYVYEHKKACHGTYLGGQSGTQPDNTACAKACSAETSCRYFAFCPSGTAGCTGHHDNKCALYSTCTSATSTNAHKGYDTYATATKAPAPAGYVYEHKSACEGKYLGGQSGTQPDNTACAKACSAETSCRYFAFCPSGNAGCTGAHDNKCALYSTCTSATTHKGYYTYATAKQSPQLSKEQDAEFKTRISTIDSDGDGCISADEAKNGGMDDAQFKQLDTNSDGKACKDDYAAAKEPNVWKAFVAEAGAERRVRVTRAATLIVIASLASALL